MNNLHFPSDMSQQQWQEIIRRKAHWFCLYSCINPCLHLSRNCKHVFIRVFQKIASGLTLFSGLKLCFLIFLQQQVTLRWRKKLGKIYPYLFYLSLARNVRNSQKSCKAETSAQITQWNNSLWRKTWNKRIFSCTGGWCQAIMGTALYYWGH